VSDMKRYALVSGARSAREVEAYLPANYELSSQDTYEHDGRQVYVIEGRDSAGWTLHDYVGPRLGSGLMGCREVGLDHPVMKLIPEGASA